MIQHAILKIYAVHLKFKVLLQWKSLRVNIQPHKNPSKKRKIKKKK